MVSFQQQIQESFECLRVGGDRMAVGRNKKRRRSKVDASSDGEWSGGEDEDLETEAEQTTHRIQTRRAVLVEAATTGSDEESCREIARVDSSPGIVREVSVTIRNNKKRRRSRAKASSDSEWSGAVEEDLENQGEQITERISTRRAVRAEGATTRSDEESSRKIGRLGSSSGVVSDGDGRLCGKVGKQSTVDNRKDAENISSAEKNAEGVAICGVCLSEGIDPLDRGQLDCCDHFFCFACIMEWAKVESRCPLCKQRFVTIIKPPRADMPRSRGRTVRIPTRNQVYIPPQEDGPVDPYANTICMECQESGNEHLLLLCDGCDSAAHTYCVGLGRSVPRGDWYCSSCASVFVGDASSGSDDDKYESELSEQVLSDISALAEASMDVTRRSRRNRRAGLITRSHRRRFGRRTRRSMPRGARGNRRVPIRQLAVQEPRPPSGILPSSSTNARTLTHQRQLQDRIQHMRQNWNSIRRGSAEFSGTHRPSSDNLGPTPPMPPPSSVLNAGRSQHETRLIDSSEVCLENISKESLPEDRLKSDIEKAWRKLEQARALRAVSGTATQDKSPEPIERQENSPRAVTRTDMFAHQSANFILFKDNPMSLNRFIKDYQEGTSSGYSGFMAGKCVKDESPLGNSSAGIKGKLKLFYRGDAVKQDQAQKDVGGEASWSKPDVKGKTFILPSFEDNIQMKHHEKYEGQGINWCTETFEGTSTVGEECEEPVVSNMRHDNLVPHLQGSDNGGRLITSPSNVPNGRKEFCQVNGYLQDSSIERNGPIHWDQTSLQSSCRKVSPPGVGVCITDASLYDHCKTDPSSEIRRGLKLVHNKKEFLQNPNKGLQCSMASGIKNSPSLTVLPKSATLSQAQSDWPHSTALDYTNPLLMKHQQTMSDGFADHKRSEPILPGCQGSVSVPVKNMDTTKEHQSRAEHALRYENIAKESGGDLQHREAVKEQVLKIISQNLKPLLKSHKIGWTLFFFPFPLSLFTGIILSHSTFYF
ncbi:hypothetical protein O6H91_16G036100 [Diphasiastrum complanatum]|uniref:Uncharacterized protein n=2 Tax=Diphasiastrum complanatum TaxID=34168 RepID=A0ACC2BCD3_DIPCM|nr:hypothetical protein O6H91_16G036100 [Diphasiastrum complanatum]